MSSIQFLCSSCRHRLQVDESQKGKPAICPICGTQTTVPVVEAAATAASAPPPNYGPRPTAPPFRTPPAGAYPYGYQPQTEPFAIASFICSMAGIVCWISSILGVIFGHIAMNKINASGGQLGGRGFAKAGLIIGYVWIGCMALFLAFYLCFALIMFTTMMHAINHHVECDMHESIEEAFEQEDVDATPEEEQEQLENPFKAYEEQLDTDSSKSSWIQAGFETASRSPAWSAPYVLV